MQNERARCSSVTFEEVQDQLFAPLLRAELIDATRGGAHLLLGLELTKCTNKTEWSYHKIIQSYVSMSFIIRFA